METITLSSTFQLVLPRRARERLRLRPGMKFTVLEKGGIIYLVPDRAMRGFGGVAEGATTRALRDEKDRL